MKINKEKPNAVLDAVILHERLSGYLSRNE